MEIPADGRWDNVASFLKKQNTFLSFFLFFFLLHVPKSSSSESPSSSSSSSSSSDASGDASGDGDRAFVFASLRAFILHFLLCLLPRPPPQPLVPRMQTPSLLHRSLHLGLCLRDPQTTPTPSPGQPWVLRQQTLQPKTTCS